MAEIEQDLGRLEKDWSAHPHLEVFSANTAEALRDVLKQIKVPHQILYVYGMNGKHYAWVSPTKKLKVKRKDN